jgi:hypothetical protein
VIPGLRSRQAFAIRACICVVYRDALLKLEDKLVQVLRRPDEYLSLSVRDKLAQQHAFGRI